MTELFNPDWTVAPAIVLREWLDEHHMTTGALARQCGEGAADIKALMLIQDVLSRAPLLPSHAEALARGTGISQEFWLGFEEQYRRDLAAGRIDITEE